MPNTPHINDQAIANVRLDKFMCYCHDTTPACSHHNNERNTVVFDEQRQMQQTADQKLQLLDENKFMEDNFLKFRELLHRDCREF